jgi:hypothetical protein
MQDAGIPREETLLWNTVPWYLGDADRDAPIDSTNFKQAMHYLPGLLRLLPRLELIVLVGGDARRAAPTIAAASEWKIVATHHMSAKVWNREEMRTKIEGDFRDVAGFLRL